MKRIRCSVCSFANGNVRISIHESEREWIEIPLPLFRLTKLLPSPSPSSSLSVEAERELLSDRSFPLFLTGRFVDDRDELQRIRRKSSSSSSSSKPKSTKQS